ncbi:hypothetical protein BH09PSE5_BH09PSE5_40090 [soil metagenome]
MSVHFVTSSAAPSQRCVRKSVFVHLFAVASATCLRVVAAVAVFVSTVAFVAPALADPPGRVGRLGTVEGAVWLLPADSSDWAEGLQNQPVTNLDRVATEPGSRTEIDIGSTTLRLAEDSEVVMQQLDDSRITVLVARGSMTARLRTRVAANEFTALTAEGKFVSLQPGYFRFEQEGPGSRATAYEGSLRFDGPDSTLMISAGQRAEFWRDAAAGSPTNYTLESPERDAFADWSAQRDQVEGRASTPVYVSPEMPGAAELSQYGQWSNTQEYGALWTPTAVGPDWAPYRNGRWTWVAPWGWTWVDEAPWGFAPSHYGRWVQVNNAWCWAPGTYAPRPVYAPALVGWVGGAAPGVSINVNSGRGPSVGWFPLAPREVFVPGYRVSPGYARNVNAGHVRDGSDWNRIARDPQLAARDHRYRNRDLPGAMTIVPATVVTNRQPIPAFLGGRGGGFTVGVGSDPQIRNEPRGGRGNDPRGGFATAPVQSVAPVGAPQPGGVPGGPRFTRPDRRDGRDPSQPNIAGPRGGIGAPQVPGVPLTPGVPMQPGQPGVPSTPGRPQMPDQPRTAQPGFGSNGRESWQSGRPPQFEQPQAQQPQIRQPRGDRPLPGQFQGQRPDQGTRQGQPQVQQPQLPSRPSQSPFTQPSQMPQPQQPQLPTRPQFTQRERQPVPQQPQVQPQAQPQMPPQMPQPVRPQFTQRERPPQPQMQQPAPPQMQQQPGGPPQMQRGRSDRQP